MHPPVASHFPGTVRIATRDDVPAIARLLETNDLYADDAFEIADDIVEQGYAFVLDGHGAEIIAVAHLRLDQPHGQLDLCVVAPGPHHLDLEARMVGIAAALCVAFGRE